jgi:transporter family protein
MTWIHWALLSALSAGITAVLAKAGTKGIEPNLAAAIRTSVVFSLAWCVALAGGRPDWTAISGRGALFLILSGVATGLSWLCYFRALHLGEVSSVAPVDKLSVVFAIVLAAVFLGEPLSWEHWVGGTLIVAGAVIVASK